MEIEQMLEWDDKNPPGTVAGYIVYQRIGVDWIRLGNTAQMRFPVTLYHTVTTFAVSCYDTLGVESERSEEVTVRWPTENPKSDEK